MKIYLMSRYGRRQEMLAVAADLERLGHIVTSSWIRGAHEMEDELLNSDPEFRAREGARFAKDDIEDLLRAECVIAFTEVPGIVNGRGRGGRHFEAGFAYAYHQQLRYMRCPVCRIICVGGRENAFYCLPEWEHYSDWPSCLAALKNEAQNDTL